MGLSRCAGLLEDVLQMCPYGLQTETQGNRHIRTHPGRAVLRVG